MKIATTYLDPRYSGIVNSLQSIMGEVTLWKSDLVPIFDFLYHFKPDMFFVGEEIIDVNFLSAMSDLEDTKIILFGNSVPNEIKPEVVCAEPSISQLMKKHLELSHNVVYVHDYVDIINFVGGERDDRIQCNVGSMFGNNQFSIELLEFLLYVSSLCNMKIVGDNNLSIPNFLGNMNHKRKLDFMKSCDIFLDINGTLLLEAAANNIFTFSTISNSLFPNVNIENFEDKYNEFNNDEERKLEISKKAKIEVMNSGTNFHRLIDILKHLDIENKDDYITKSNEKIEEVLNQ